MTLPHLEVLEIRYLRKIPVPTLVTQFADHSCFPGQPHRLPTGFSKAAWLLTNSVYQGQWRPLKSVSLPPSLLMSFLRPSGGEGLLCPFWPPLLLCSPCSLLWEGVCTLPTKSCLFLPPSENLAQLWALGHCLSVASGHLGVATPHMSLTRPQLYLDM